MILPVIIIAALLAIGYLTFGPRGSQQPDAAAKQTAAGQSAGTDDRVAGAAPSASSGTDDNRRAVDQASDAADVASGRMRGSPTYVSATTLDTAFFTDPYAAALRYTTPLRVSGIISAPVQPGPTPSVFMEGRTRLNSMIVNFPDGYQDRLTPLYKGKAISVACSGVKSLAGTTILSGCILL